jgi:hypothetical protein
MKSIDARNWDSDIQRALTNASAAGGAKILLNNGEQIVVISPTLWALVERDLPSLSDALQSLRDK